MLSPDPFSPAYQDPPLADEAGADNTVEASGNDGSDAGDDAGFAAIGVVASIALGAEDDEGATSLLLQPRSAIAHRSAKSEGMGFIEVPFWWRWSDRASSRGAAMQA